MSNAMIEIIRYIMDRKCSLPIAAQRLTPKVDLYEARLTPFAANQVMLALEKNSRSNFPGGCPIVKTWLDPFDPLMPLRTATSLRAGRGCLSPGLFDAVHRPCMREWRRATSHSSAELMSSSRRR